MNTTPQLTKQIILDASSVINLAAGRVLQKILAAPECAFSVGAVVHSELGNLRDTIDQLTQNGLICRMSGIDVSAAELRQKQLQHGIGPGEAECIIQAGRRPLIVCTDDRRARKIAEKVLGRTLVTGSIGLLKDAVQVGALTESEAWNAYTTMKAAGAFLPTLPVGFFSA